VKIINKQVKRTHYLFLSLSDRKVAHSHGDGRIFIFEDERKKDYGIFTKNSSKPLIFGVPLTLILHLLHQPPSFSFNSSKFLYRTY